MLNNILLFLIQPQKQLIMLIYGILWFCFILILSLDEQVISVLFVSANHRWDNSKLFFLSFYFHINSKIDLMKSFLYY